MTEAEAYTAKENAKDALLSAFQAYVAAAVESDLDDWEQAAEIEDLFTDAGKKWCVLE